MNKITITEAVSSKSPLFLSHSTKGSEYCLCRYNQLLKQKVQLEELEKVLKTEQDKMLQQSEKHETVAAEYKRLRDENER